jgi:hypothetical protein
MFDGSLQNRKPGDHEQRVYGKQGSPLAVLGLELRGHVGDKLLPYKYRR